MLIVKGNRSHNTVAFTTPYNFCQKKCCHSKNDGVKIKGSNADKLEPLVFKEIKEKYDVSNKVETIEKKAVNNKDIIKDIEIRKQAYYEKYKLGEITRLKFIEEKKKLDDKIEVLIKEQSKVIKEKEKINEEKLTRELMDKYIKSIVVRGNEILKIEWK